MATKLERFERAGVIGVDAGLCWIGDPCYVVTPDCTEHPARSWNEFCNLLQEEGHDQRGFTQFECRRGPDGLGVCVSTGHGDGVYPVYVRKNQSGRIAEVRVIFDDEEEADEGTD